MHGHMNVKFTLIFLSFPWLRRLGQPSADYIAISLSMAIKGSGSVVKRDKLYNLQVFLCTYFILFSFIY
jgi:hypothetical protein